MKPVAENCDVDPLQIPASDALAKITAAIEPVTQYECIAIRQCLGRVLAEPLLSNVQVPNHTNSAMDGYAFRGDDLAEHPEGPYHVIGTAMAGAPFDGTVGYQECVRIMTGAVMPKNSDTVVAQERTQRRDDEMSLTGQVRPGENVRHAGEDMQVGDVAIAAHTRLGAAQIGLAASLGVGELVVYRKPRVAFFSNGDELRSVGQPLELGDVYDSNRYTLYSMLQEVGVEIVDLGIVRDDRDAIRQALQSGADCADMVITSAGASVGDADYVKELLDELGQVSFWKVAIKPGRPLSFGRIADSVFFGLPGNPVSVMVTFQLFVRQALKKMAGERDAVQLNLSVKCLSTLKKRPGRAEYQRGVLSLDENNETVVRSTGEQGSGILSSMAVANCYIILGPDSEGAEPGDLVMVQPFDGVL